MIVKTENKARVSYPQANKRAFKGVWIPREIWLSKDLSVFEKVLLTEINSLDNENGCMAGNRYFADFFGISQRQIREHISKLFQMGLIKVEIINRNRRIIRMEEKLLGVGGYLPTGVGGKPPHSNIINNNILSITSEHSSQDIQQVFDIFYKTINPTINFGHKTSRTAADFMVKKFGIEKTCQFAKFACDVQGRKFAPTITTPLQLKEKLSALRTYALNLKDQRPSIASIYDQRT